MKLLRIGALLTICIVAASGARSQEKTPPSAACGITGSTLNPEGGPVAGALIQVTDQDSGRRWDAVQSDSKGQFRVSELPEGKYRVTVSAPNFKTNVYTNISVPDRQSYTLPVALKVGEGTITIDAGGAQFMVTPRPRTNGDPVVRVACNVQVSATYAGTDPASPSDAKFDIQFYNAGTMPVTLLLGDEVGSTSYPTSVTLLVRHASESPRRLTLSLPLIVAGSLGFFRESLASGDSYSLHLNLSQFYDLNTYDLGSKLSPGTYSARFEFVAKYDGIVCNKPPMVGTVTAPCWTGTKITEWVEFTVPAH